MALRASGRSKRLALVSLDERCVLGVVAVDAQRRDRLGQVIVEFLFAFFADFVCHMAGVTSHIEGGVAAAFFWHVQTLGVAIETEVFALLSGRGFQQLIPVVGTMRVVTFDAVAYGGRMHGAFQRGRIFVGVAGDAQRLRSRSDELYASDVFVDPHFMAAQTARRDGGVDKLAFRLILVALEALGCIDVFI